MLDGMKMAREIAAQPAFAERAADLIRGPIPADA
jgi:hypothetical protein